MEAAAEECGDDDDDDCELSESLSESESSSTIIGAALSRAFEDEASAGECEFSLGCPGEPLISMDFPELLFVALCTNNQEGRPGRDFERARRCDDEDDEAEVTEGPIPPFL